MTADVVLCSNDDPDLSAYYMMAGIVLPPLGRDITSPATIINNIIIHFI